ncbi:MAG: hypothetical protein AAF430_00535 [Myxococcota bacterium]
MNAPNQGGNAPSWLFSFVDLAFLLLIAMTQLAEDAPVEAPVLGELVVPRIEQDATASLPSQAHERWQLRIHPPSEEAPFELVRVIDGEPAETERAELEALRDRLSALQGDVGKKPLLAPHEDSRSQDLLDAVALLEELWPGTRRATVSPRMAQR